MARPLKKGIDYFSHDVNMNHDIKIKLLKAKFGLTGYAVFNLLLEDIYKNGYYLEINEDYTLIFCSENSIDESLFNQILEFTVSRELFSKVVYSNYKVITSKRIQENYLEATKLRKYNNAILDKFLVNAELTGVNVELTDINTELNTQSKVNDSKVNEIKEKNKDIDSDFENFWNLYDKKVGDKNKIIKKFNALKEADKTKIFESLPEYIISTPDKKFRKNPETYLNNHSWNDEIIKINSNGTIKSRRNTLQDF